MLKPRSSSNWHIKKKIKGNPNQKNYYFQSPCNNSWILWIDKFQRQIWIYLKENTKCWNSNILNWTLSHWNKKKEFYLYYLGISVLLYYILWSSFCNTTPARFKSKNNQIWLQHYLYEPEHSSRFSFSLLACWENRLPQWRVTIEIVF